MASRRRDTPPPQTGLAEKDVLLGFLDYLRGCVIGKVQGLPEPQVRTPGVPSGTNLLGLVKHLTHVERYTFLGEKVRDWPATFHADQDETVGSLVAGFDALGVGAHDRGDRSARRPHGHPPRARRRLDGPLSARRRLATESVGIRCSGIHGSHPSTVRTPVSQTSQRELGDSDRPIEDELEDAFQRMLDEGTQRLHRTWREVLVTGFFGGTEVAVGVLAYLSVLATTQNQLLAGVAFSIGFLALLLGRSELFTEGFLVPVTTVAAKRASVRQLLKLWTGTLIANLAGGWAIMWLIMTAYPKLHAKTIESATHFATAPLSAETVTLSLLGGMVITLMTRMQHGTDSTFGKIAAAVAGGFLLAGLQMFHSILDSLLIFGALVTNDAPFGYADWAYWFGYTVVGNVLGGLLFVTLLRLLRTKDRLQEERHEAAES